jgi:ankyrin repeat protein
MTDFALAMGAIIKSTNANKALILELINKANMRPGLARDKALNDGIETLHKQGVNFDVELAVQLGTFSPLAWACANGELKMIETLLSFGMPYTINRPLEIETSNLLDPLEEYFDMSPLVILCKQFTEIRNPEKLLKYINLLLEHGADPNQIIENKENGNKTLFQLFYERYNKSVLKTQKLADSYKALCKTLLEYGASPDYVGEFIGNNILNSLSFERSDIGKKKKQIA